MPERRQTRRIDDTFYRVVLGLNVLCWLGLVVALILFHFARPELVTGVQEYWGVKARTQWSETLSAYLIWVLRLCLGLSLLTLLLRVRRTRRKGDSFGVNLVILMLISAVSLITIGIALNS